MVFTIVLESCDWSAMLMRMYLMWCEKNGYKVKEIHSQDGDVAGIKTVTLEISGDSAFGYLKGENGVHRLVRVSPFNAHEHSSKATFNKAKLFIQIICSIGLLWK